MTELDDVRTFETAVASSPRVRSSLLPLLHAAQEVEGYVSDDSIAAISRHVRVTVNEIEGVVTGYPEFSRHAPSRHVIRVCTGESCRCRGAQELSAVLERRFGVKVGERSAAIEIEPVPCLFICGVAPAIAVDGRIVGRVTGDHIDAIERELSRDVAE